MITIKSINPDKYKLTGKVTLHEINKNHIAIVKDRKSRIVMNDGIKIHKQAKAIWLKSPNLKISFLTSAPVCSKTTKFLLENNIEVIINNQ